MTPSPKVIKKHALTPLIILEVLTGTIIACLAFGLFLIIAHTVLKGSVSEIDQSVSGAIYSFRSPSITQLMLGITFLGGYKMLVLSSLVLFGILFRKKYYHEALLFIITFGMGGLLNLALKTVVARARPDISPLINERFYSFPSGHSMNAFVFYALLAYFTYHFTRSKVKTLLVSILCSILVLLIGISRIYLGVHYPSDIVAGFLAGAAWFCTIMVVERTLRLFHLLTPGGKAK